jgi:hypothetical protein
MGEGGFVHSFLDTYYNAHAYWSWQRDLVGDRVNNRDYDRFHLRMRDHCSTYLSLRCSYVRTETLDAPTIQNSTHELMSTRGI